MPVGSSGFALGVMRSHWRVLGLEQKLRWLLHFKRILLAALLRLDCGEGEGIRTGMGTPVSNGNFRM